MPRKRIIPKFLLHESRLVKGVRFFEDFREAGNPVSTARVYDSYGVDEMIFLDIDCSSRQKVVATSLIEEISEEIFMPFTVGGGVNTLAQIEALLAAGADKISICSEAARNPSFIREAALRFGDQCIVVNVDYKFEAGNHIVYANGGRDRCNILVDDFVREMEDKGAGEIMLTSIDHDGTMGGYDLEMINRLASQLQKPLIASSGAGNLNHLEEAFTAGASAVTVSSMFIFTDNSPIKARTYLAGRGIDVRNQKGSHS